MGLCGDYLGWDSEIGEFNSRNQSRKRYAKREQVKIDALSERNEDEAFKVPEAFCCATYDPARSVLLHQYSTLEKQLSGLDLSWPRETK